MWLFPLQFKQSGMLSHKKRIVVWDHSASMILLHCSCGFCIVIGIIILIELLVLLNCSIDLALAVDLC